ncbi:predicted protein [Naegleria gruberi]|uniref:Predicted protein n=1 Tax=Naegleria gruberi TaxID=5762 RepID=D2UYK7_NAEGR|nr:uncharacterized protein NAEGRDRAFT_45201 [Naegleria gruberi]EFC50490.1 predicted protein [Naegleria gruberi]|eukprot:XP_002683234.1 predicted protein [Naegleria gruberi strain NEG-M]
MKRKHQVNDDSDSDSDEDYYEEPKKQRHSTGSAFMNAFNSILSDSIILDNYSNYENLPLGIKFKVVLRSFRQMTIIEKFFIFNKLHNISYSTIREADCIALLSLGFSQITEDEIGNLQTYFKKKGKSSNYNDTKYTLLDFENNDTRLYWQLSYQTWVTFYHDMVDCYTTRYNSRNPNEIPSNFNETLEQISRDSNFYAKAIHVIRKKLRHIPGKTSGSQDMSKLYNNLTDVLSTMEEASMEKVDGIHMINEKILSANFFFHFLQSEEDKKSQLGAFLLKKARIIDDMEIVKVLYPINTKTSFTSLPISILNLEKSILFFNEFIKARETSLIKPIRGTHIKTKFSNYGRKEQDVTEVEPTTTTISEQPKEKTVMIPHQQVSTPSKESPSVAASNTKNGSSSSENVKQQPPSVEPATAAATISTPTLPQQTKPITATVTTTSSSAASSAATNSDTATITSPPREQQTSKPNEIPVIDLENDKLDAAGVFRNWWVGEYRNFDFSKHQAVLSAKRLLQFFSTAMRQKDPTFHIDSSHTSWRVIRKAIEKGEIHGLRVEGEGGRSFKVINQ